MEDILYRDAISVFGLEAQLRMAQEECAELTVAVSKVIREPGNEKRIQDLIEETADVLIMCGQIAEIYGKERVDAMVLEKRKRLGKRLDVVMDGKEKGLTAEDADGAGKNKGTTDYTDCTDGARKL